MTTLARNHVDTSTKHLKVQFVLNCGKYFHILWMCSCKFKIPYLSLIQNVAISTLFHVRDGTKASISFILFFLLLQLFFKIMNIILFQLILRSRQPKKKQKKKNEKLRLKWVNLLFIPFSLLYMRVLSSAIIIKQQKKVLREGKGSDVNATLYYANQQ